jgi:ArsR family transcriptional regulator
MASVFKALSDPTRLEIIALLMESQNLCVNVIAEKTGMSQPAISQHLKVLKNAGFLEAKKMGMHVHYSINQKKAAEFISDVNNLFDKKPEHNCTECRGNIRKKK